MRPFMHGFIDELRKVAAFPQHEQKPAPFDSASAVGQTMKSISGAAGKSLPQNTPPVESKKAPTPLTTPNYNVTG